MAKGKRHFIQTKSTLALVCFLISKCFLKVYNLSDVDRQRGSESAFSKGTPGLDSGGQRTEEAPPGERPFPEMAHPWGPGRLPAARRQARHQSHPPSPFPSQPGSPHVDLGPLLGTPPTPLCPGGVHCADCGGGGEVGRSCTRQVGGLQGGSGGMGHGAFAQISYQAPTPRRLVSLMEVVRLLPVQQLWKEGIKNVGSGISQATAWGGLQQHTEEVKLRLPQIGGGCDTVE